MSDNTSADQRGAETIVIFGAGNIGRSFLGQIFGRAGFLPVFIDVDQQLIDALNDHRSYTVVHRHPDGREDHLKIAPVRAVAASDTAAVRQVLAETRYVGTAVGAAALPRVLPVLADEMARRRESSRPPFDVILAENIHGAGEIVRDAVPGAGVVECSVGKMVPLVPASIRAVDIRTVYAEAFNTLIVDREGWKNPIPPVPELFPVSPITAWIDRKLYIHNLGHATAAYLSYAQDPAIRYISEAIQEPTIQDSTRKVMRAAARGLQAEHPGVFTEVDLHDHIEDLLYRFSSAALGDTVFRVGRDLQRKLAPADRIVGALRLLQRHRLDTAPVENVYRAALRFRAVDDQGAPFEPDQELLDRISAGGGPVVLAAVSGFDLRDPDDAALLDRLIG